jgi:glycosyltransferase involved in cell wall biosynthesis
LFLVPDPVDAVDLDWCPEAGRVGDAITLFAPDVAHTPSRVQADRYELVLQAFAIVLSEIENARLMIEVAPDAVSSVLEDAAQAGLSASVDVIGAADCERAMSAAYIVIAAAPRDHGPGAALISALAHARAVLAADVAQNREVTPQGRGCLWYRNHDARDLAGRAAFLARNPDFRTALGISGRAHVQATRSPRVVARKYDDVYRHAFQRRSRGGPDALHKLEMVRIST